jgi:hypothetical protein
VFFDCNCVFDCVVFSFVNVFLITIVNTFLL